MRELSFKTFLEKEICDYLGSRTLNIHKLYKLGKKDVRLMELLFLYCCYIDKRYIFDNYNKKHLYTEFPSLNKEEIDNEIILMNEDSYYYRHYYLYKNKINHVESDNKMKLLYLSKIRELQQQKEISNYKIYKAIKGNPGNINDYLTNGNYKKVSLNKTKEIYNFVNAF